MTITAEIKQNVVDALIKDMKQRNSKSQAEYTRYIRNLLDIPFDESAFSIIKKETGRSAIKETSWLKLAFHFGLMRSDWNTAQTTTFNSVQTAMKLCQENGIWQVLCDRCGVGKSYAAKHYAKTHKGSAIYVDCSENPQPADFILALGRQLGIPFTSTYSKMWQETMECLVLIDHPILICDELGDVDDRVITLLKGLYNKADNGANMELGFYGIGADNLRQRLINGRKYNKRSYAEFWSRFDNNITTLNFTNSPTEFTKELREELELIVDANLPVEIADKRQLIIDKCMKTLGVRAVRKEIALQLKINNLNAI